MKRIAQNSLLTNEELVFSQMILNDDNFGVSVPLLGISAATLFIGFGKENLFIILAGATLLLLAAFLLITTECISINKEKNTIRIHKKFLSGRGKTYSLYDYSHIVFTLDVDTANRGSNSDSWKESRTLHYEVFLIDGMKNKLLLAEFPTQKESKRFIQLIADHTGLTPIDKWVPFHTLK